MKKSIILSAMFVVVALVTGCKTTAPVAVPSAQSELLKKELGQPSISGVTSVTPNKATLPAGTKPVETMTMVTVHPDGSTDRMTMASKTEAGKSMTVLTREYKPKVSVPTDKPITEWSAAEVDAYFNKQPAPYHDSQVVVGEGWIKGYVYPLLTPSAIFGAGWFVRKGSGGKATAKAEASSSATSNVVIVP